MVKNDLKFERLAFLENEINATIVLKILKTKKKAIFLVANYRQWTGSSPSCTFNSKDNADSLKRFKLMLQIWESVLTLGGLTIIGGDLNIDRLPSNNPVSRPELKLLIEALVDFQTSKNLIQMNHKATRHRINQRSALIDLFYTNCPKKCTNILNGKNTTSEHDYVMMTVVNESIVRAPQFFMFRDSKHLNYSNLEPKINNSEKLQSLFADTDPETIAVKFTEGWNEIINEMAHKLQIQIRKDHKKLVSPAAKKLKSEHDKALNTAL